MKLVDILARELKVWPELSLAATQDDDGDINHQLSPGTPEFSEVLNIWKRIPGELQIFGNTGIPLSDDYKTAIVTRAEWQTAVDALNVPKVVEWDGVGLPPVGASCEMSLFASNKWELCIPVYYLNHPTDHSDQVVVYQNSLDGDVCYILDPPCSGSIEFRPVRTAEQVAAEEREKAAEALYMAVMDHKTQYWPTLQNHRKEHYRSLVDAGWQKVAK